MQEKCTACLFGHFSEFSFMYFSPVKITKNKLLTKINWFKVYDLSYLQLPILTNVCKMYLYEGGP